MPRRGPTKTTMMMTMKGRTRRRWTNDNDDDGNNDNDDNDDAEEVMVQTGPSSGDNMANLAIDILRADQGSYMLRLLMGVALVFNRG
jgi:hypothetical protein